MDHRADGRSVQFEEVTADEDHVVIDGIAYRAKAGSDGCTVCDLFELDCEDVNCTGCCRKDGRNVLFVKDV